MTADTLFVIFVAAPATATLGVVVARAAWARRRQPRPADQEPAHTPAHPGPVEHIGATEQFGDELHALRDADVSPELVSDIETELRWGLIWHDFEHTMQAAIDAAFLPIIDAWTEVDDFDELRVLVGPPQLTAGVGA